MKKNFSNVMLVAVAAMTLFSCQKQETAIPEVSSEEVVLTFTSEKPAFDDETKTEWTGETIQWSAQDQIAIAYTVEDKWQNASGDATGDKVAKLYKSTKLAEACLTSQFNVNTSFKGTTEGTHVFYGVFPAPSETDFPNAPVASLTVPAVQTPKANSFDATADLLVGVSEDHDKRPEDDEKISLMWDRLVAHAVLTLKNINGFTAGEKITRITLTAQDDANLVGKQNVNLITKEVEKNNNASNVIAIAADNLIVDNGTVTFWACMLPTTITSLTVNVETDKATYVREITGISKEFKKNARNTLSINMASAVKSSKYWIVASDKVAKPVSGTYGYLNVDDVWTSASDAYSSVAANAFTIKSATGGYTIQDAAGKYYYMKDDFNSFNVSTTAPNDNSHIWNIVENQDGTYTITNTVTNKYIQYSSEYNSFGSYANQTGVLPTLVTVENPVVDLSVVASLSFASAASSQTISLPEGVTVVPTTSNNAFTATASANIVTVSVGEATEAQEGTLTLVISYNGFSITRSVTLSQSAPATGEEVTIIIDGSTLTGTATTGDSDHTFDGVTVTMSKGAKYLSSASATNKFSDKAIMIGKQGAYIYNKTAIPGNIVKFEIYANKGASAKVTVGVNFSANPINEYNSAAPNTYTKKLETLDNVYDCSTVLPDNAKYFWYQVTNGYNSQIQFRITYISEN